MTDNIPVGSYLIRNVGTGYILTHINYFNVGSASYDNVGFGTRDDGNPHCREYQTWWIEPIPEQHEFFEKKIPTLYTITQLASAKSLDASVKQPGAHVYCRGSHGAPWQLWRLVKVKETVGNCVCYNIVSEYSGLAFENRARIFSYTGGMQEANDSKFQQWELVVPMTPIPAGWHQLQNVDTGHVLKHSYLSSLPTLASPIEPNHTSNYKETWATQWAIIHGRAIGINAAVASYVIKNRLTGGFLRPRDTLDPAPKTPEGAVSAWQTVYSPRALWILELDGRRNWKITDAATSNLLGEAVGRPFVGVNTLECCDKQPEPCRSWRLVPMEDIDAKVQNDAPPFPPPPMYQAGN